MKRPRWADGTQKLILIWRLAWCLQKTYVQIWPVISFSQSLLYSYACSRYFLMVPFSWTAFFFFLSFRHVLNLVQRTDCLLHSGHIWHLISYSRNVISGLKPPLLMFSDMRSQRSEGNMPLKASPEKQKTYKVLDKARTVFRRGRVHLGSLEWAASW